MGYVLRQWLRGELKVIDYASKAFSEMEHGDVPQLEESLLR